MKTDYILVGISPLIKGLKKEIPSIGKSHKNVLICGEKGTGKTLVSHLIHQASDSAGQLIVLNPFGTTDSNLADIEKGSKSHSKTLLFQDVEDFSYLHQAIIARIISNLPKKPFTRVIVTLKNSPQKLRIEEKLIGDIARELKGWEEINLSPLSTRSEDIPHLVEYFAANACNSMGLKLKAIDINTLDFLTRRNWNENIKELKSVVERGLLTTTGEVLELPEYIVDEKSQLEQIIFNIGERREFAFDKTISNLEKTLIKRVLDMVGYHQTKAAEILGLSESNLRYRIRKFHLLTSKRVPLNKD
jgi:two-component system NtrC family response regulator